MKIVIERATLQKALAHVQSVVERRNTIPILANVMLRADDGELALTATDMDLTIVETAPAADIVASGATTAPAHTLYDIVRKLPEGSQVEIAVSDEPGQLSVTSGRSSFKLASLPEQDFPAAGEEELPHGFALEAETLRTLIDRTRFAISTEETRYYLNGIYLHAAPEGKVMRAVATDGHRLARMEMALPDGAADMPGVIVPRKTVGELRRLLEDHDDAVRVSLSETRIRFTFGDVVLNSKLIDGTFPDYERVIPASNDKVMEVDCKAFSAAVDRVSTISTEKSRAIKLAVGGNNLTLSATSPDAGSAREEIEVEYAFDPIEIGFNSKYLLDIAGQIEGGGARFVMSDAASPTIVKSARDESALYVLMPMRV